MGIALVSFAVVFCLLSGCAHLTEAGKKIWGTSIAHLERVRDKGKGFEIDSSLDNCFNDIETILKNSGATVYLKDKNKSYLAAMNFKGYVDTTEVGVFFSEKQPGLILVDVASLSPKLAAEVADTLFKRLKGK